MKYDVVRLHQLLGEGKCCASVMVQLGLELKGKQNELLIQAASGLCRGVHSGLACGALTGAACMMNVLASGNANAELIPELVEWFTATYGNEYGGIDCKDITGDTPANFVQRCPALIEATYIQAKRILSDYGYCFD